MDLLYNVDAIYTDTSQSPSTESAGRRKLKFEFHSNSNVAFMRCYFINKFYWCKLKNAKFFNFIFISDSILRNHSNQLGFYIPQRYWLTLMGFLGLVMAYSLRLSLSVAITQMVPPPLFNTVNLTNANGEMEIICPFNDSNYIHEHFDYVAIFDSLYSVK